MWGKRSNTCNTLQARGGSLAIVEDLNQEQNRFNRTPIPETTMDRFMSEGGWDYVENLLSLDKIISPTRIALVKGVQLFHVLKSPGIHDRLLYVPRRGIAPARPETSMDSELRGVMYAETQTGNTAATQALLTANPSGQALAPVIMVNGHRYLLTTNDQAANNASSASSQSFAPSTASNPCRSASIPNAILPDFVAATGSKLKKTSTGNSSKSKSKFSSSRSVGPRPRPKSATK